MLSDLQKFLMFAALLSSALYLTGVFVAGLATSNGLAWKLALVSEGMCFIAYVCQYLWALHPIYAAVASTAVACSVFAGAAAGMALLLGSS